MTTRKEFDTAITQIRRLLSAGFEEFPSETQSVLSAVEMVRDAIVNMPTMMQFSEHKHLFSLAEFIDLNNWARNSSDPLAVTSMALDFVSRLQRLMDEYSVVEVDSEVKVSLRFSGLSLAPSRTI